MKKRAVQNGLELRVRPEALIQLVQNRLLRFEQHRLAGQLEHFIGIGLIVHIGKGKIGFFACRQTGVVSLPYGELVHARSDFK